MSVLTYKGYHAKAEYRPEDKLIFGEVLDLDDAVLFEVRDATEVEVAFHAAVDEYLAFCEKIGKRPEKPYSGRYNVRVEPDLHREAVVIAEATGSSLNELTKTALQREVKRRKREIA
jgi:predicted HicB family RNase H-like nuclease